MWTGVLKLSTEVHLRRLGTDRIDLYLLHWRGNLPLTGTLAGFADLLKTGKIRHWGVSNLDTDDMEELVALPSGSNCATNQTLASVAARHCATPAQVALAWLLRQPGMMVIPRASSPEHVRENRAALDLTLTTGDLAELDKAFPPPRRKRPLEVL